MNISLFVEFHTGIFLTELFGVAIEINKHKAKIKDAISKILMNTRIEMTENSDMEIFTEFLKTFNPNMERIDISLPNDITAENMKEMFNCLSVLPKKV